MLHPASQLQCGAGGTLGLSRGANCLYIFISNQLFVHTSQILYKISRLLEPKARPGNGGDTRTTTEPKTLVMLIYFGKKQFLANTIFGKKRYTCLRNRALPSWLGGLGRVCQSRRAPRGSFRSSAWHQKLLLAVQLPLRWCIGANTVVVAVDQMQYMGAAGRAYGGVGVKPVCYQCMVGVAAVD